MTTTKPPAGAWQPISTAPAGVWLTTMYASPEHLWIDNEPTGYLATQGRIDDTWINADEMTEAAHPPTHWFKLEESK